MQMTQAVGRPRFSVSLRLINSLGFDKSSSDSTAHLSGLVREAVTDARIVVNVDETGVIQSGTLKGLVERLIINFSLCRYLELQSRI
jgi:hypothetical protein